MNKLDKDYCNLLQDILDNGVKKQTRNGEVFSVFGRQIRHSMKDGFPILTTKKMAWKQIVTELLWFLRGDTNIKYLVDNDCHIWDGDAYKKFKTESDWLEQTNHLRSNEFFNDDLRILSKEEFINKIKTDDEFAKKWGELGPIYGKQWRRWTKKKMYLSTDGSYENIYDDADQTVIDQIAGIINELKTNPDSRRLMVSAWNVGELDQMVLPPCHYGFQVYTRELSLEERVDLYIKKYGDIGMDYEKYKNTIPTRAISLMWNQRSVDTFLGLPFNIASYGLLLEIIAREVNMVPDELIGNLGDVHLYSNHIEQAKEQIGRELTVEERMDWWFKNRKPNRDVCDDVDTYSPYDKGVYFNSIGVPKSNREPFELPKLVHMKTDDFYKSLSEDLSLLSHLDNKDFTLENYQSHPTIKAKLTN